MPFGKPQAYGRFNRPGGVQRPGAYGQFARPGGGGPAGGWKFGPSAPPPAQAGFAGPQGQLGVLANALQQANAFRGALPQQAGASPIAGRMGALQQAAAQRRAAMGGIGGPTGGLPANMRARQALFANALANLQ